MINTCNKNLVYSKKRSIHNHLQTLDCDLIILKTYNTALSRIIEPIHSYSDSTGNKTEVSN